MRLIKLVLMLFLVSATCPAAVVKTLDLDGLAAESDTIVHGRVVASRVEWNSAHTSILTLYTVEAGAAVGGVAEARAATEGPPAGRTARELTQFLAQVSQAVERVSASGKTEVGR